jgi:hypothetical protein
MTSFAFSLGVFPLVFAVGAGSENAPSSGHGRFQLHGWSNVVRYLSNTQPDFFSVIMTFFGPKESKGKKTKSLRREQSPLSTADTSHWAICLAIAIDKQVRFVKMEKLIGRGENRRTDAGTKARGRS